MPEPVLTPVRRQFRAVAEAVVPEAEALSPPQWDRGEGLVERSLAPRPEQVKRQLRLFLKALDWLAVLRYGRLYTRLSVERRRALLRTLERAPLLPLRRGVWGVRTLAFMAYYGLPEVRRNIGYHPDPGGWEALPTGPREGDRGGRADAEAAPGVESTRHGGPP